MSANWPLPVDAPLNPNKQTNKQGRRVLWHVPAQCSHPRSQNVAHNTDRHRRQWYGTAERPDRAESRVGRCRCYCRRAAVTLAPFLVGRRGEGGGDAWLNSDAAAFRVPPWSGDVLRNAHLCSVCYMYHVYHIASAYRSMLWRVSAESMDTSFTRGTVVLNNCADLLPHDSTDLKKKALLCHGQIDIRHKRIVLFKCLSFTILISFPWTTSKHHQTKWCYYWCCLHGREMSNKLRLGR